MSEVSGNVTPEYLDEHAVASMIGLSVHWLRRARGEKIGPRYVKIARRIRYRRCDVLEWVESGAAANDHVSSPKRARGAK